MKVALLLVVCLTATSQAATIAGQEAKPGTLIEIQFPVSKYFQDMAAWANNPRPQTGRAVLSFPPGFDPARRWPIMVVTSSTDFSRGSSPEYARYLKEPANSEGWMIVASDATIKPNHDSTPWRVSMLGAALEAIRKDLPQSRNWPIAFCGHSGGAKRSCLLGAMFAKANAVNICGFFLSGINDDKMSESYKTYQPGPAFLNIPVWISGGNEDPIATPGLEGQMMASMRRTGFTRIRLEHFPGGHQMRRSELKLALRWFRQLGGF